NAGRRLHDSGKGPCDAGKGIYNAGKELHDAGKGIYNTGEGVYNIRYRLHDAGEVLHDAGQGFLPVDQVFTRVARCRGQSGGSGQAVKRKRAGTLRLLSRVRLSRAGGR
ncbi:MAG: hypothetical protein LBF09_03780, partial [Odoribacteraceae bacterium]|nr:hypothetical protein [Odoribacteraceae bacterium]